MKFNNNVLSTIEALANAFNDVKDYKEFTATIKAAKKENDRAAKIGKENDGKLDDIQARLQEAEERELSATNAAVYAEQQQVLLEQGRDELKQSQDELKQVKTELANVRRVLEADIKSFDVEKQKHASSVTQEREELDAEKDRLAELRAELEDRMTKLRELTK